MRGDQLGSSCLYAQSVKECGNVRGSDTTEPMRRSKRKSMIQAYKSVLTIQPVIQGVFVVKICSSEALILILMAVNGVDQVAEGQ